MAQELHIENLLASHLYLLDGRLRRVKPQRQVVSGKKRYDLYFETRDKVSLVELKKTELTLQDLRQLLGYCRQNARQGKKVGVCYLVGKRPVDGESIEKRAHASGFKIRVRYLNEHIPLKLLWDKSSRKYIPYQENLSYLGEPWELRV